MLIDFLWNVRISCSDSSSFFCDDGTTPLWYVHVLSDGVDMLDIISIDLCLGMPMPSIM